MLYIQVFAGGDIEKPIIFHGKKQSIVSLRESVIVLMHGAGKMAKK